MCSSDLDVTIIATGPGSGVADGTILYGSATQGGWDAGAVKIGRASCRERV